MAGPLALVGSGEYTETMLPVERALIHGRSPRYVQVPTAASSEGPARLHYWVELGRAQAARLGVEAVPLVVTNREEAEHPAFVDKVEGAGLIYLSGGSPALLARVLRDTALWRAILTAWDAGAALAGCSAGAMALADHVPNLREPASGGEVGLGLLPHIRVVPHFDKMTAWVPDVLSRPFFQASGGISIVGIDEETALVGGPQDFTVQGRRSVWLLGNGKHQEFTAGMQLNLPAGTR